MHLEYIDIRRRSWDAQVLASILTRLVANGYLGLVGEAHQLVGRFARTQAERPLAVALSHVDAFADILIPPAQPHARVILFLAQPDVLRVLIAGRTAAEVRRVTTATKMHLEAVLGGHLDELKSEAGDRGGLERFRREVLPALHITATGGLTVGLRDGAPMQVMLALRRQPAFRGRPTALGSQIAALLPDKPAEQAREAMEQLVSSGIVERLHVVMCRQGGQWLAVAPGVDEIKSFVGSNVACPHCGRRVGEESQDVAYRLTEMADAQMADNRPLCELLEAALRRAGVEGVVVDPGRGPVDGVAYYHGAVLLFRAHSGTATVEDAEKLIEQAKGLEHQGWHAFCLLLCDQPAPPEVRLPGVLLIDDVTRLDGALGEILGKVREQQASLLLPPVLRPLAVSVADLLPTD